MKITGLPRFMRILDVQAGEAALAKRKTTLGFWPRHETMASSARKTILRWYLQSRSKGTPGAQQGTGGPG